MNILVTVDEHYLSPLNVMLWSLLHTHSHIFFRVFLLHTSVPDEALTATRRILEKQGELLPIEVNDSRLDTAPTTARYPKEIYYRIFAARYLPKSEDRVLYLDPDLIVNGSLEELYNTDLSHSFFAAASHTGEFLRIFNKVRLDMEEHSPYINSGVMLMNLKALRKEQDVDEVFRFIEKRKNLLILPDQDIISALYGSKILPLDAFRYNMTERLFRQHAPFEKGLTEEWVRRNAAIIHYCGKNKPWKERYNGKLNIFYNETLKKMRESSCTVS